MRLQDWLWGKMQVSCAKFNGDEKNKTYLYQLQKIVEVRATYPEKTFSQR